MIDGVRYLLSDDGRREHDHRHGPRDGAGGRLFAIGIPYVKTTLHASDSVFGALVALWGVGMAIGAYISQRSAKRESDLFRLGLGASGAILIFMARRPECVARRRACRSRFGAGLSIAMVLGITVAQRSAPDEMRGRVMSADPRPVADLPDRGLGRRRRHRRGDGPASAGRCLPGWDGNRYAFLRGRRAPWSRAASPRRRERASWRRTRQSRCPEQQGDRSRAARFVGTAELPGASATCPAFGRLPWLAFFLRRCLRLRPFFAIDVAV